MDPSAFFEILELLHSDIVDPAIGGVEQRLPWPEARREYWNTQLEEDVQQRLQSNTSQGQSKRRKTSHDPNTDTPTRMGIPLTERLARILDAGRQAMNDAERRMLAKCDGSPNPCPSGEVVDNYVARLETAEQSLQQLQELYKNTNQTRKKLRYCLNSFHNPRKYTTYGRHFTLYSVLQRIADKAKRYLQPDDVFVDFSCGVNEFAPLLGIPYKSFDIFPARNNKNFVLKNWFDVTAADLPKHREGHLIIGLNPPFGERNRGAVDFVKHAVSFRPRVLVLIMPAVDWVDLIGPEYSVLVDDQHTCGGQCFYVPGSKERLAPMDTPHFLVLVHKSMEAKLVRDIHAKRRKLSEQKRIMDRLKQSHGQVTNPSLPLPGRSVLSARPGSASGSLVRRPRDAALSGPSAVPRFGGSTNTTPSSSEFQLRHIASTHYTHQRGRVSSPTTAAAADALHAPTLISPGPDDVSNDTKQ